MWHTLNRDKRKCKVAHCFRSEGYGTAGGISYCSRYYPWNYTNVGFSSDTDFVCASVRRCNHCVRRWAKELKVVEE